MLEFLSIMQSLSFLCSISCKFCFLSGLVSWHVILSRALSYISLIAAKEVPNMKPELDTLIIRTLIAYQSIPDPMAYKNDHPKIIQLCTMPFRWLLFIILLHSSWGDIPCYLLKTVYSFLLITKIEPFLLWHWLAMVIFLLICHKRDASRCEESTCLRLLLDKRDAWLGPWIPGRCISLIWAILSLLYFNL